ncbi:unnamed protein product [[Actinomadura] parvosata subsp. kistnae]|nr:unnamed protein product [Actinomadura parvosata subsp. kistnae]
MLDLLRHSSVLLDAPMRGCFGRVLCFHARSSEGHAFACRAKRVNAVGVSQGEVGERRHSPDASLQRSTCRRANRTVRVTSANYTSPQHVRYVRGCLRGSSFPDL